MLRTATPKLSQIQDPIAERLDRVVDEFRRIVAGDFDRIGEINDYLLQVRGKLFRPSLLLLCSEVGGRSRPEAEALAAVVELIHLSTLVHDDAVDHSVLRRGMPTVNAMWSHQVAIIMGDYLYSRSISELARLGDIEPVRILAAAANAMSVGELRQLASCDALDFSERDYHQLIDCKTASLISAACELGALYGDPALRAPLGRFGHELGMAFQIVDDLLDYTSDEAALGKPAGLDLREHKVTLPLLYVLPRLSAADRTEVEEFFANPEPSDGEIAGIVRLVRDHGGLDYAKSQALAFAQRAREALDGLPAGRPLQALQESIAYVVDRRR
jgi:octaprenyl-diphosphate synthase